MIENVFETSTKISFWENNVTDFVKRACNISIAYDIVAHACFGVYASSVERCTYPET